jgi:hypothetical protein
VEGLSKNTIDINQDIMSRRRDSNLGPPEHEVTVYQQHNVRCVMCCTCVRHYL